jgi:hypothetical protein
MDKQRPPQGRVCVWLITGVIVGGLTGVADGALLGVLFGNLGKDGAGLWPWIGGFALGSAVLGGILGVIARAVAPRMVLRPPGEEENHTPL